MTTSNDVPSALRPVLEALVELAYAPLDDERTAAAWNRIGEACEAALVSDAGTRMGPMTGKPMPCPNCGAIRHERDAHFCAASDAGTPEQTPRGLRAMTEEEMAACEAVAAPQGEPFFHKLGCPKINGTAAHCTCQTPPGVPAPPTTAPKTSTSLVGAAPDAELDRLLNDFGNRCISFGISPASATINHCDHGYRSAAIAAIHAHVARRVREARGEVVASGKIVNVWTHLGTVEVKVDRLPVGETRAFAVDLVRRREKEEG